MNNDPKMIIIQCIKCLNNNRFTQFDQLYSNMVCHWTCGACDHLNHSLIGITPIQPIGKSDKDYCVADDPTNQQHDTDERNRIWDDMVNNPLPVPPGAIMSQGSIKFYDRQGGKLLHSNSKMENTKPIPDDISDDITNLMIDLHFMDKDKN